MKIIPALLTFSLVSTLVCAQNISLTDSNEKVSKGIIRCIPSLSNNEPLYIIKISGDNNTAFGTTATVDEIKPNWIKKIKFVKDTRLVARYGTKATDGLIIITIKKLHKRVVTEIHGLNFENAYQ